MSSETLGTETSKHRDSHRDAAFSSAKSEQIELQYREYKTILLEVCVSPERSVECVKLYQAEWSAGAFEFGGHLQPDRKQGLINSTE